ncbi:MAG: MotA/TolQ/ExbB proton channel family protein [Limnochordia bacterium]|jgi:biopolymer transport protein ExbB
MLETLAKGGPVMIPLGLCSVVALAIFLERGWYYWRTRSDADVVIAALRDPLTHGNYLEALQIAKQAPGPFAGLLSAGIAYADKGRDQMRAHLELAGRAEIQQMERSLPVLGTITTISPLLGLLGTVFGIIRSFRVLSALQGIEGPSALSAGIAEALITTAVGLTIAIPSAAVFDWFSSIVDRRVQEMNRAGNLVMDIVSEARGEA